MTKYHHLCLVSKQLLPNYFPALEHGMQAMTATLTCTPGMEDKFKTLKAEFEKHGIPVEKLDIADANDFNSLETEFTAWMARHEGENLVLNVTGGTKPMAIVAQEVFRMAGKPIFYVDVNNDKLFWMDGKSGQWDSSRQLEKPIDLATLLRLHDIEILSQKQGIDNSEWLAAATELAQNAENWGAALSKLNGTVQEGMRLNLSQVKELLATAEWQRLLETLMKHKLVNRSTATGKGGHNSFEVFCFRSDEARQFACGGWLEIYLYTQLRELCRQKGQTLKKEMIALNVKVKSGSDSENEMDVLLVANRKLFAFECKTGAIGTATSFKLGTLTSNLGGLRATGTLVSYQPLSDKEKARCKEAKLEYIGPNELSPQRLLPKLQKIIRIGK